MRTTRHMVGGLGVLGMGVLALAQEPVQTPAAEAESAPAPVAAQATAPEVAAPVPAPVAEPAKVVEWSPKPRFSAPIAVPENARAGAENRAQEDAAKAAAEAREAEEARSKPTKVVTGTVMRADDHRFSVTVFRQLRTFFRW